MEKKQLKQVGFALVIGIGLGYLASLLVPEDTHKKQKKFVTDKIKQLEKILMDKDERERIRAIFNKNTQEATAIYSRTKKFLIKDLASISGEIRDINKQKYLRAVNKAVQVATSNRKLPKAQIARLKRYLEKDFEKLAKVIQEEG